MNKKIISFFVVSGLALTGCNKDYYYVPKIDPTVPLSYATDIQPIWDANCNSSGCHATGDFDPDLTPANSYAALFSGNYVDTITDENSIVYQRMISITDPMPPSGGSATDAAKVLEWIKQGAKNN